MSAVSDSQYRPVSTLETSGDDGLSVRAISDMADSANNAAKYVFRGPYISECFQNTDPGGTELSQVNSPAVGTEDDTLVLPPFPPFHMPKNMTHFRWTIITKRTDGADDVIWSLRTSCILYKGTEVYDSSKLISPKTTTITTDSDSYVKATQTHVVPLWYPYRTNPGDIYITLSAQNQDAATRAGLYSLTVQPYQEY